jgi:hypothetical protein
MLWNYNAAFQFKLEIHYNMLWSSIGTFPSLFDSDFLEVHWSMPFTSFIHIRSEIHSKMLWSSIAAFQFN